jgi:hypothetical protein
LLRLIQFFFELCLLRRVPQDLPASRALLGAALVADLLTETLFATAAGLSLGSGLAQSLVDIGFMLALLYGMLHLTGGAFLDSSRAPRPSWGPVPCSSSSPRRSRACCRWAKTGGYRPTQPSCSSCSSFGASW